MKYINKIFTLENMIFLVFLIFSIYSYQHIFTDNFLSKYSYSELFINYQAGFIRRGLLGELFWQTKNYINIDPKIFFGIIFYVLYLFQIYFLYKICKTYEKYKIFLVFIIFAPQLILFPIYDYKVFFLKDIFIKFTIFLHGYLIIKYEKIKYLKLLKYLLIPLLTISIFIHEYQVLFIGIHFLLSISVMDESLYFKRILKYYSILIIPTLLIFLFLGSQQQYNKLNEIVSIYNAQLHPQLGGGLKNLLGGFYIWHLYYFSYRDFVNLFFSFFLSIAIPVLIFENFIRMKICLIKNSIKKNYFYYFIPTLVCFLALDHGRNISLIATHFVIFYMTTKLNNKSLEKFLKKIYNNINYVSLIILFILFYIFLWKLDQYAGFGLQGKHMTIFSSSLFGEFIKFIKLLYSLIDTYMFNLPDINL